ncbi:MAG TPA: anti-sigma factor [Candidatus Binataceae bacterium]|nr:anti-sigma factor [Candidatus Binataceae bacterium]
MQVLKLLHTHALQYYLKARVRQTAPKSPSAPLAAPQSHAYSQLSRETCAHAQVTTAGNHNRASLQSGAPDETSAPRPWWSRLTLWRALAGAAFALALSAIIEAVEISLTLIRRTAYQNRRIESLNAIVERQHRELAEASRQRHEAFIQGWQSREEGLTRILDASDAKTIKMVAPPGRDAPRAKSPRPAAVVTVSASEHGAVLHVPDGLLTPLPADRAYHLWWIDGQQRVTSGGEFLAEPDGRADVLLAPPVGYPVRATVTIEPRGLARAPTGPAVLTSAALR